MRALTLSLLLASCLAAQSNLTVPGVYFQGTFPPVLISINSIQQAVDLVSPGGLVTVLPGTYQETVDFRGKPLILQGDPLNHSVIIDAQGLGPVVRFSSGEGPSSILSGFVLQGGVGGPGEGGGIHCGVGSSPTIEDCIITGCQGGSTSSPGYGGAGGVHSIEGEPTLRRCRIEGNTGGRGGAGGIDLRGLSALGAGPWIESCQVLGNQGGAAIAPSIFPSTPAVSGAAGGLSATSVTGLSIIGCHFEGNRGGAAAGDAVGGVAGAGAGGLRLVTVGPAQNQVLRTVVLSNVGGGGRADFIRRATGGPGGLSLTSAYLAIDHCLVAKNQGGGVSQALPFADFASGGTGGMDFSLSTDDTVVVGHCTVTGNIGGAASSCGISQSNCPGGAGGMWVNGTPRIHHCIVKDNQSAANRGSGPRHEEFRISTTSMAQVEYSNLGSSFMGLGTFSADPGFVDAANDDYRLDLTSGCVNRGDSNFLGAGLTDFEGQPRVQLGQIDVGFDELDFRPHVQAGSTAVDPIAMDVNGNSHWSFHSHDTSSILELFFHGSRFAADPLIIAYQASPTMLGDQIWGGLYNHHLNIVDPGFGYLTSLDPHPIFGLPVVGSGYRLAFNLPPVLAGNWIRFQGFVVSPLAANGLFASSKAHDVEFR